MTIAPPLAAFVYKASFMLIQESAELARRLDLAKTVKELEPDLGFPKVEEFDYIIVGGGTAGCLLAEKLSRNHTVLLLEKGGKPPRATENNRLYDEVRRHPAINDLFPMTTTKFPDPDSKPLEAVVKTQSVGRMLGGSGSHNRNIYNRGNPKDYDSFASLTGDAVFEYANVIKHFKKIENYKGWLVDEENREELYGTYGPIAIETTPQEDPLLLAWFKAGDELNFTLADPNGHQTRSFTPLAQSHVNLRKSSSYTAILKPILGSREYLKVYEYSMVDRIIFEHERPKAWGVEYRRHGLAGIAHARKEVILSAGAVGSPLLLLKSGVGPEAILKEAGIPVVKDLLGVGNRLQDHPIAFLTIRPDKTTPVDDFEEIFPFVRTDSEMLYELKEFHTERTHGLLSFSQLTQAFEFSKAAKDARNSSPDLYASIMRKYFQEDVEHPTATLRVALGRSKSEGRIVFDAKAYKEGERDDTKLAKLELNFFGENEDLGAMGEAMKLGLDILRTEPFAKLNFQIDENDKKCIKNMTSGEVEESCIKNLVRSFDHLGGTCRMGKQHKDKNAVVGPDFRVIGIEKLRVVDASVLPHLTNANINAAVLVFAEIAGEKILYEKEPPVEYNPYKRVGKYHGRH